MENGTRKALSPNGNLLNDVINKSSLHVLNFDEKCSGKWTRVQEKNGTLEKSIIDYAIVSGKMAELSTEILIDEEKLIAPFWIRKSNKNGSVHQYSDHNAILVKAEIPNERHETTKDKNVLPKGWKISDDGIEQFAKMTETLDEKAVEGKEELETKDLLNGIMDNFPTKNR